MKPTPHWQRLDYTNIPFHFQIYQEHGHLQYTRLYKLVNRKHDEEYAWEEFEDPSKRYNLILTHLSPQH